MRPWLFVQSKNGLSRDDSACRSLAELSSESGFFKLLCFPCPHVLANALSKTLCYSWTLYCNNEHHDEQEDNPKGLQLTCWAGDHSWSFTCLSIRCVGSTFCFLQKLCLMFSFQWLLVQLGCGIQLCPVFPLQWLCQGCQLMVPSPLAIAVCGGMASQMGISAHLAKTDFFPSSQISPSPSG